MSSFNHGVSFYPREYLDIRSTCVAAPRCFATPVQTETKLTGSDYASAIDLWQTAADANKWYELGIDDATGFFGDSVCESERCPGVMIVYRGVGSSFSFTRTNTWTCPAGTVKWVSVSSAGVLWFQLDGNTQFLSELPAGCTDVGNERRCPGGSYTVLVGSLDPAGACTATSLKDIACTNPITGGFLRGACEGYADCTAPDERRIESVPFEYPSGFVNQWSEGVMVALADDNEGNDTASPTTTSPTVAPTTLTPSVSPSVVLTTVPPTVASTSPPTVAPTLPPTAEDTIASVSAPAPTVSPTAEDSIVPVPAATSPPSATATNPITSGGPPLTTSVVGSVVATSVLAIFMTSFN